MSIKDELTAIREGAAIFPLDDRAFLRITGEDATRWLNGMVTNSIQSLAPGEGNYNFLLNAQGRIQGDCTIYREPIGSPAFVLATDKEQLETIQQHLDKFIIMDDVTLDREKFRTETVLLLGTKAQQILESVQEPAFGTLTFPLGPFRLDDYDDSDIQLTTAVSGGTPRFELTVHGPEEVEFCMKKLEEAGAHRVSREAIEAFRILSGIPRYGQDIRNSETARDLPQETNQTHALHFTKGCYLGQEIVERIHSRGQVHRTFTGFRLTALPTTLPAPLTADGKPAGELTSAAIVPLPEGDTILALGYARREALDRNAPLTYEGGTATPTTLPINEN